jgi:two-component system, chemotaxis family, CheB/CheR fusion protein
LLATAHLSDGSKAGDRAEQYFVRLAPYRTGNQQIEGVVVTFVDIASLARAEARQRLLIAELQHRARNMLTAAQFLANQTLGKGGSLDSFVARLTALGRVQGPARGAIDAPIELEDFVRLEVQVIGVPADGKVTFSGPPSVSFIRLSSHWGLPCTSLRPMPSSTVP